MRAIGGGCASDIRKEQPGVLWLSIGSFYGGCWTEGEKREEEEEVSRTVVGARGEERETQPDEERSEGDSGGRRVDRGALMNQFKCMR